MATIRGTSGRDSLTGTSGDDLIQGLENNDTLNGLGGNDTLDAGTGGDRLIGGTGNDTYIVDGPGDTVIENAGGGIDTVRSSATRTLDANVENLTLTGLGWINGTGNALNNVIAGNDGNNVLDGATGADRLVGFGGDDTYIVDGPGDTIVEQFGGGTDTVRSSATRTLEIYVENLTLTGSAAINGTGNALGNVMTGNSAANRLAGGAGDDQYFVGSGDTVVENAGQGRDSVFSPVSRTLEANVEILFLTGSAAINGTGNSLDNALLGNDAANRLSGADGNDTLRGAGGSDTMNGGLGNDEYDVTPGDVLSDSGGVDTVLTRTSWTLAAGFENLTAYWFDGVTLTGNSSANVITAFSGNNLMDGRGGNDSLNGATGADTMRGGDGNDRLAGRGGNDTVTGGGGRDFFVFLDTPPFGGVDRITDFVHGTDELLFENAAFTRLGASGAMASGDGRFRAGAGITTGQDPSDRLIYNTSTDQLYYDADGSGSGGSVLIATFANNPTLTATDFTVI